MEQALIAEGMPVEEVQRLCDVFVAVLKGRSRIFIKGHRSVFRKAWSSRHTFKQENRAIEDLINNKNKTCFETAGSLNSRRLRELHD